MQKETYHKKPTYDEMVKESITNPTDKIALPDREATQLRNTPQLTRFDDESFLDLNTDNQQIMMEQLKQIALRQTVSTHTIHTHTIERAKEEDASMPQAPPPGPPPPGSNPKLFASTGTDTHPKLSTDFSSQFGHPPAPKLSGGSSSSGYQPPPPPPAAGSAAQTVNPINEEHFRQQHQFAQAIIENRNAVVNLARAQGASNYNTVQHYNPQTYVTQIMEGRKPAPPPADPVTTGGNHHPPPPPGGTGTPILASTVGTRKPEQHRIATRSRSAAKSLPPPKSPKPDPPPSINPTTTAAQIKKSKETIGEEAIKVRGRSRSARPTPMSVAPKPKPPPAIIKPETGTKRNEATGSGPTPKMAKAHETVVDLPNTVAQKAAPPPPSKAAKPPRVNKPKAKKPSLRHTSHYPRRRKQ